VIQQLSKHQVLLDSASSTRPQLVNLYISTLQKQIKLDKNKIEIKAKKVWEEVAEKCSLEGENK